MKIVLVWAKPDPEMQVLFNGLKNKGHEIVYWVGEYAGEKNSPSGAVFHDHYDAWDAKPSATYANTVFPPPSVELIEQMRDAESVALTMMNKHYDAAPVDERKQIYYSMLGYWHGVFERLKPDALVCGMVPHSVYDYIAFELAKKRGMRTIMFDDTWIAARLLYYTDFWRGSDALKEAYERNKGKEITLEDLGEELRHYYIEQTKEKPAKPPYLAVQRRSAEGIGLLVHRLRVGMLALKKGSLHRLAYGYARRVFKKNLRQEYEEVSKPADLTAPYVYFPLGFQPERTTCPQGGMYCDQIHAVRTIAAGLPEGWRLYVKEHPSQWWMRSKTTYTSARYKGYYRRIASVPNVTIVPIHTDSHTLTEHSKTVATVTGTAGWEALLRGKRPLVFGYPWYMHCPGVLRVSSTAECARVLREEITRGDTVTKREIIAFLKSMEEASLRAYIGDIREFLRDLAGKEPSIPKDEQMRIIVDFLSKELARS